MERDNIHQEKFHEIINGYNIQPPSEGLNKAKRLGIFAGAAATSAIGMLNFINGWSSIYEIDSFYPDKLWDNAKTFDTAMLELTGGVMITIGGALIASVAIDKDDREEYFSLEESILARHPEWKDEPPDPIALRSEIETSLLLPPIGGKLNDFDKSKPIPLPPALTAENYVSELMKQVKKLHPEKGDSEFFVSQLAVQGRRGNDFRYVALALLTASPYVQDWNDYFYEASWGKVGPLIHDGGRVSGKVNPKYKDVVGRTDFILRVGKVWDPNFESIIEMAPEDVVNLPVEDIENALQEQKERERLLTEAKAYQRLALAYDVACSNRLGLTDDEADALSSEWFSFTDSITNLYEEYGVADILNVKWFRNKPTQLGLWNNRYEGKWKPIKKSLKKLDAARIENPEMVERSYYLLKNKVAAIDTIIQSAGRRIAEEYYEGQPEQNDRAAL